MCNAVIMGVGFAIGMKIIDFFRSPLPSWLPSAITPVEWGVVKIYVILLILLVFWLAMGKERGGKENV